MSNVYGIIHSVHINRLSVDMCMSFPTAPNLKGRPRRRRPGKFLKDSYMDSDDNSNDSDLIQYRTLPRTMKPDGIHKIHGINKIKIINIKHKDKMVS